jgi:selenocysteine lyase/cysteine desulfurase
VLGVCNNIAEISQIVHRYGAHLLVDAAQLIAHRKVDMEGSNIDYLAFSAHKAYAPFGCGVLVVRKGILNFKSSEMELIQSFGEENTGGIAALGKALLILKRIGMDTVQEEERILTMKLLHAMEQIKGIKIYGIKNPESTEFEHKLGVIAFSLGNIIPNKIAKELALRGGIGIRYGCHCAHILVKRILNIGSSLERFQWLLQTLLPGVRLPGVARVSIGIENNGEDVDSLIQTLKEIAGHVALANNGTQNISQADANKQIKDFVKASARRIYSKP